MTPFDPMLLGTEAETAYRLTHGTVLLDYEHSRSTVIMSLLMDHGYVTLEPTRPIRSTLTRSNYVKVDWHKTVTFTRKGGEHIHITGNQHTEFDTTSIVHTSLIDVLYKAWLSRQ